LPFVEFQRLFIGAGRGAGIGPRQHGNAHDVRMRDRGDCGFGDPPRYNVQMFFGSEQVSQTLDRLCCCY
jgi:hypothetical protein